MELMGLEPLTIVTQSMEEKNPCTIQRTVKRLYKRQDRMDGFFFILPNVSCCESRTSAAFHNLKHLNNDLLILRSNKSTF